jgi:hypothetical protein
LLRGYPLDGEVCDIPGFGTTTVEAVRDMIATGDPVLKAIVTNGKKVVGVVHMRRRPNAYQKSALDWLFPTCAAKGCGTRGCFLETDHREDWARTHITVLELLDRLCRYHHRLKTTKGWALVEGTGKRDFVPPDDPRHPRYGKGPKATCASGGEGVSAAEDGSAEDGSAQDGSAGGPDEISDSPGWRMSSAVGTGAGAAGEGRDP